MLEPFRQMMEHNLGLKQDAVIQQVLTQRLRTAAYYLIALLAALVAFAIASVVVCWATGKADPLFSVALILLALAVVVVGEYLRTSETPVSWLAGALWSANLRMVRMRQSDFMIGQSVLALILVVVPFALFLCSALWGWSDWVYPWEPRFGPLSNRLEVTTTFAGWLLAGQIALFNFLFSYTLGKYSTKLARVIITHRAVAILQSMGILALLVLFFVRQWGCPALCLESFWLAQCALVSCLIMTIVVARKGVDTDGLIIYAGHRFSRQLKRRIHRPITSESVLAKHFWRTAGALALDFRSLDRFSVFTEPVGAALCKHRLMSLFNAAMKTVSESQHESLCACLYSITMIMDTYASLRSEYMSSTDSVFAYCNDQFAALLRAAEKSPNEYLVEEIVKAIGAVGRTSLRIKGVPMQTDEPERVLRYRRQHAVVPQWTGLLKEAFDRLHLLQRSRAPSDILQQLRDIALIADASGFATVIVYSYIPAIEGIIAVCMKHRDAYHQTLMVQCLRDMLIIWRENLSRQRDYLGNHESVHHGILKAISGMITAGVGTRLPNLVLDNVPEVLACRLPTGAPTIQDIFVLLARREIKDIHEQRECVDGLKQVISLAAELATEFAKQGNYGGRCLTEALYELGFLVLMKLPPGFEPMHDPTYDNYPESIRASLARQDKEIPHRVLDSALFKAWQDALPSLYTATHHMVHDWEQDFFGFVGLAVCVYREHRQPWLKEGIRECIVRYLTLIRRELKITEGKRISNGNEEYLQLCGAWLDQLMDLPELAKEVLGVVALLRCIDPPSHFGGNRYEALGYPRTMSLEGGFYLPPLRNIRAYISRNEWDTHMSYQQILMSNDILFSYYEKVEAAVAALTAGSETPDASEQNSEPPERK